MPMSQAMQVLTSRATTSWFTPPETIGLVRAVLGEIDLDPATNLTAQAWIQAKDYFTKEQDGLSSDWGGRVWLNPYEYGKICPCHGFNAQPASNSSQRKINGSRHVRIERGALDQGAESAKRQKKRSALPEGRQRGDRQKAAACDTSLPLRDSLNVQGVCRSSPLMTLTLLATLEYESDLSPGVASAFVNTLGLNRREDVQTLLNALRSWLKSEDIANLSEDAHQDVNDPKWIISSADSEASVWHGTGPQRIGQLASNIGISVALTAEKEKSLRRIISFLSQALNVPELCGEISSPHACLAIVQKIIAHPTTGVSHRKSLNVSLNTSPESLCKGECVSFYYPSRVFLNPPFDETRLWIAKLIAQYEAGNVTEAIALVNSNLGYSWYESLWRRFPVCCARERIRFIAQDGTRGGQAKRGQTFVYLGANVERFRSVFSEIGRIILPEAVK